MENNRPPRLSRGRATSYLLHPLLPRDPGLQPDVTCSRTCLSPVCSACKQLLSACAGTKKQDLKNSEGWSRRFTACPGEALCALSLQTHWVRGNEEFPFLSEIQKVTFIYSLCLQYDTNFRESEWTKSLHVCPQGQKNSLENLTGHLVISIPVLH